MAEVNQKAKCPIVLYSSRWFWQAYLEPHIETDRLWIANYSKNAITQTKNSYPLMQYSESGSVPGVAGNIDLDQMSDHYFKLMEKGCQY